MTINLTHYAVVQALTVLAAENPAKVNPPAGSGTQGCYYTTPEGKHCIAGEIITRLGGTVPPWGDPSNTTSIYALIRNSSGTEYNLGITLSPASIELLYECQREADCGTTWGEVVERLVTS